MIILIFEFQKKSYLFFWFFNILLSFFKFFGFFLFLKINFQIFKKIKSDVDN